MSLLDRISAVLDGAGARYAVIGAAAMAAHGVARSTHDIDLLTLANVCLGAGLWAPLAIRYPTHHVVGKDGTIIGGRIDRDTFEGELSRALDRPAPSPPRF